MHVSINDPRVVTHAGPSVRRVCPAACTKAIISSSINRERGLETEIEAKYIYIVGSMAFDVHPCFYLHILNYYSVLELHSCVYIVSLLQYHYGHSHIMQWYI